MTRSLIFVLSFVSIVFSVDVNKEFDCLASKCPDKFLTCKNGDNCIPGMSCIEQSNGNMTQFFGCYATFYSIALSDLINCGLSCFDSYRLPEAVPTECRKPATESLQPNFDLKYLTGKFYNIYGLNRLYECDDNTHHFFMRKNANTLIVVEWYDLRMLNGTPRHLADEVEYSNAGTESPSVFNVNTIGSGWIKHDEYRVMSFGDNYVFLYYCGKSSNITYEGAFVLSRKPTISEADKQAAMKEAAKRGWDLEKDFCRNKQDFDE